MQNELRLLRKEVDLVRSQLAQSEFRADALQRKVDESVAALEESAALLEQREHADSATLHKMREDNRALQQALLAVDERGASAMPERDRAMQELRLKNASLEEELAVLRARFTTGGGGGVARGPHAKLPASSTQTVLGESEGRAAPPGDDSDAKSQSSLSAASEFSVSSSTAAGSPEVCGVGMRLTNVAPHRVC